MHHSIRRSTAAGAYSVLDCARRHPGTTGQEAVERIAELVLALSLTGVPLTARPNKQTAGLHLSDPAL
jgi:hypothetical protein